MKQTIKYWHEHVTLVKFRPQDVAPICDYWCSSSDEFMISMGVDPSKRLARNELETLMLHRSKASWKDPSTLSSIHLSILVDGKFVGVHTAGSVNYGKDIVFHAHITDAKYRGQGLSAYTYPRACKIFMDLLALEKVIFITPVQNRGPNIVKQRLGIPLINIVDMDNGLLLPGLKGNYYELTRERLEQILASQSN